MSRPAKAGPERIPSGALRLTFLLAGVAVALCFPSTGASQVVRYIDVDPIAVDVAAPRTVRLRVAISGSPESVQLVLVTGEMRELTDSGGGVYPASLGHAEVLHGYRAGQAYNDFNHNHFGFLDLYAGGVRQVRYNLFMNVVDERVAPATVTMLSASAQLSRYVANLVVPELDPDNPSSSLVAARFYQLFADRYDFLNVVFVPQRFANRDHVVIRNSDQGVGLESIDQTAFYGSAGRLRGLTRFPNTFYFDTGETGFVHELGHQWIRYLQVPGKIDLPGAHWPLSSLAQGVMGYSGSAASGYQGLQFPYELVPLGNGDYRTDYVGRYRAFHDFDLYLMGLLPAAEVGPHFVFVDQEQTPTGGGVLHGPTVPVTVQDVVAAHGPRVPAYPDAPSVFTVATVVASTSRLLDVTEMAFMEHFAGRAGARVELPTTLGFVAWQSLPFALATSGRGCLVAELSLDPPTVSAPASSRSGASYTVSWAETSVSGVYELEEATVPSFADSVARFVAATSSALRHDVTVTTSFYYRVRAVDACDGRSIVSPWSDAVQTSVIPYPRPPRKRRGSG